MGWISTSEQLPKVGQPVSILIWGNKGWACYSAFPTEEFSSESCQYWTPLPDYPPPLEEGPDKAVVCTACGEFMFLVRREAAVVLQHGALCVNCQEERDNG